MDHVASMIRCSLIAALAALLGLGSLPAAESQPPGVLRIADIDLAACQTLAGSQVRPAARGDVLAVLGLSQKPSKWSAGRLAEGASKAEFRFRLAFQREIPVGTLFLDSTADEVYLLRPDAPYPGDTAKAEHWTRLAPPARRSGVMTIPAPPGLKTRAILLVDHRHPGQPASEVRFLRVLPERWCNVVPASSAYADREYTPPNTAFVPEPATNIPAGTGRWVNAGKDNTGMVSAPAVSDIHPSWFLLAWRQEQPISGVLLRSSAERVEMHTFDGLSAVNPRAGTADEWRKVRKFDEEVVPLENNECLRWVRFPEPIRTRGLRLTFLRSAQGAIVTVSGLHALVALGDRPAPEAGPVADQPPPFRIPYQVAEDGMVTMVVNDAAGRRVKNLFARQAKPKGVFEFAWDLKDEVGNFVAPGAYRWTGLCWPEFRVRYETTVYPNVLQHAPENSPWLNGSEGSGGWLADHTQPCGVCAVGDRVYLSASVAESGVSLIECDLEGRKKWGHHSFAAWTGPRYMASDGKEVFAAAQILGTTTDCVWAVDMAGHKVRNVLTLTPSATRKRGMMGVAAVPGKVYLSVRAAENWMENGAAAEDVDIVNCLPFYREKRNPRVAYEIVPNPRGDFVRLFRLAPHPPGGDTQYSLSYLETVGGAGLQQHVVLAFHRPVPLGSVVFPLPVEKDVRVRLSVQKPGAPYPPNAEDADQWLPFASHGQHLWDAVPAPEGTRTRALRITFARAGSEADDPLKDLLDPTPGSGAKPAKPDQSAAEPGALEKGTGKARWKGRLEGMKLLRRRFANVAGDAAVRVNSGKILEDGTWDAQRTQALTEVDPAVYLLEWKAEQALRGLAIKEIDGARTKIDVFVGKPGDPVELSGANGWQEVADYQQQRRDVGNGFGLGLMNPAARYVDGYVDFGREVKTRAVRLRVVEQWADKGQAGCMGIRVDLGGGTLDAKRCRVFGVAALKYLGGEIPIDSLATERIEVYDPANGKLLSEVPIEQPSQLATTADGQLLAISGKQVVRVDPAGKAHPALITDLQSPVDLAVGPKGEIFVYDGGKERQDVRVYRATGKFLRTIGTPGGIRAGAWDPTRLGEVSSIDVDRLGQLWVVGSQYWPKRITLWDSDGKLKKEFLGNTQYGGGGVLDPQDKTRLFYGPLEFEIDWKTGASRLKNLTWLPGWGAGEVPIRANGRTYMVTRPITFEKQCAIVYLYEKDHLRMAAAVGSALDFDPLKRPEVLHRLGSTLADRKFIWCDRNGDGEVQAEEVTLSRKPPSMHRPTPFNQDLSVQSSFIRYQVREFLPSGVPVYEEKEVPGLKGLFFYRLNNGNYHRQGEDDSIDRVVDAGGKPVWSWRQEGWGGHASHHAKPFRPDQVVAQLGLIGHAMGDAGGLGEFLVVHTNTGAWHVWTADGLLVGPIFRDLRDPKARPWSMKEHERGMALENITTGEEHFQGYFCRTADNRYYAVAGHNHASVLEVLGMDRCRRIGGDLPVTSEDLRNAQQWDLRRQREEVYERAPVVDVYRLRKPPEINANLDDWGAPDATMPEGADLRLGYDDNYLYLACSARLLGPLANHGHELERLFKTGAAFDLQLGTDPAAPPERQAPQAGDVRLLLTLVDRMPVGVVYRPVVPGTPPEKAVRVKSPVGEATIDEIKRVVGLRMRSTGDANSYVLEAAVPLAELGMKPSPGLRLKFDWGFLVSGPEGTEVFRRVYWANHATQITSDAPSEARLHPNLWGHARFLGQRSTAEDKMDGPSSPGEKAAPREVKKDVLDILDELKQKPDVKPGKNDGR
jgi:hypothetical protein